MGIRMKEIFPGRYAGCNRKTASKKLQSAKMNFTILPPPQPLSDYVRFFWFLEGSATEQKPFDHRILADPCPEFIFYYKGQFRYKTDSGPETTLASGIFGQKQTYSKVASKEDFGIFGIYLYPHALPQLFCFPAYEVTNQSADIKSICGKAGEILEEEIMLASNNHHRVKLASDFLEARLKNVKPEYTKILSSIKEISNSCPLTSIKTLAYNHSLSLRQFERKFREFSGFSPKLFLRIIRFNSIIKRTFENKSLTEVAYEYGYYDQAHFIRDFQKFSGYRPKEYFTQETMVTDYRATAEFEK